MTDHIPCVSVGMPVCNSERWIREAIDSVLDQTYRDLELVISDNASTDATPQICCDYIARDSRVRYHRNSENIGLNQNYNRVFQYAVGKYFKWASSNDVCDLRLIERCVEILDRYPDVVLCYGRTAIVGDRLEVVTNFDDNLDLRDASPCLRFEKMVQRLRLNNVMNGVIRTDMLRKSAPIGLYFSSDVVLMGELALRGKFVELPERMFYRRMTAETSTKLGNTERVRDYYKYYNSKRNGPLFQYWKLGLGYFRAATRAPLSMRERACVYWRVLQTLVWNRRKLVVDVYDALRGFFVRSGPRV